MLFKGTYNTEVRIPATPNQQSRWDLQAPREPGRVLKLQCVIQGVAYLATDPHLPNPYRWGLPYTLVTLPQPVQGSALATTESRTVCLSSLAVPSPTRLVSDSFAMRPPRHRLKGNTRGTRHDHSSLPFLVVPHRTRTERRQSVEAHLLQLHAAAPQPEGLIASGRGSVQSCTAAAECHTGSRTSEAPSKPHADIGPLNVCVQIVVGENEPSESAIRRFRRAVMQANVIPEVRNLCPRLRLLAGSGGVEVADAGGCMRRQAGPGHPLAILSSIRSRRRWNASPLDTRWMATAVREGVEARLSVVGVATPAR
jgi:hypothetical protein